jgi:hypothetical protein
MKDTRTDLVTELEAMLPSAGSVKASKLRAIIAEAKAGQYHDFKSRHAGPKHVLVVDLQDASCNVLAARVMAGEYDEKPDKEDKAAMREEIGPELADRLGLK